MIAAYWTPDAILEAIRVYADKHGYPPTTGLWKKAGYGHPHAITVWRVFPDMKFGDVVRLAGVEPAKRGPRQFWTEQRIIEAMLDWLGRYQRWPTQSDWFIAAPEYPPEEIVRRRFGTWRAAKRAAGWNPVCEVCSAALAFGRAEQRFCSRSCGAKARRRRVRGLPVADALGCVGCGGELDNHTTGCKPCSTRRHNRMVRAERARVRRASVSSARRLAAVESALAGAIPDAEVFAGSQTAAEAA